MDAVLAVVVLRSFWEEVEGRWEDEVGGGGAVGGENDDGWLFEREEEVADIVDEAREMEKFPLDEGVRSDADVVAGLLDEVLRIDELEPVDVAIEELVLRTLVDDSLALDDVKVPVLEVLKL